MRQHRGAIVEAIVRRSGFTIKVLAEKLRVSRNTVYNKFREQDLSYEFIAKVGEVVRYDFTTDFPELKTTLSFDKEQHVAELWRLEQRYARLLERHHRLLTFLVKVANEYNIEWLKKDIDQFLDLPIP